MCRKYSVKLIELRFVLYQARTREIVKVVNTTLGYIALQRFE